MSAEETTPIGNAKMALKLAAQFIAKGIEMEAYKGCVMSGEHALKVVEHALEASEEQPQPLGCICTAQGRQGHGPNCNG